jgi:hypothetical protein
MVQDSDIKNEQLIDVFGSRILAGNLKPLITNHLTEESRKQGQPASRQQQSDISRFFRCSQSSGLDQMTSQKNFNFPGTTQIAKTPQNATKSHKKPQKATKRHKKPQKATKRQTPQTQTSQKHFEPQRHNHGERYNVQPTTPSTKHPSIDSIDHAPPPASLSMIARRGLKVYITAS